MENVAIIGETSEREVVGQKRKRVQKQKTCEQCGTRPNFNTPGLKGGRFCTKHKLTGMVNVRNKRCEHAGCGSSSRTFNTPGSKQGRFCKDHKGDGMVDVRSKRCEHAGCGSLSRTFNTPGLKQGRFCKNHKSDGMVDVAHKTCENAGCNARPCFNTPGLKQGKFCKDHKGDDMVDVISKRCEHAGCDARPSFNTFGSKQGRFCKDHKVDGMVDVKHKRCEQCDTRPSFNMPGLPKRRFCADHMAPGMVDVSRKLCVYAQCKDYAVYGIPGHVLSRCREHKEVDMIQCSKSKCITAKCKEFAIFGVYKPTHCEAHTSEPEVNLVEKRCSDCGLLNVLDVATQKCASCQPGLFQNLRLAKQKKIERLFNSQRLKYESTDRVVDGGACGKERPDFLFATATHFVIVEVDEYQHRSSDNVCEVRRMFNLAQGLGMSTIFIRYNPDNFTDSTDVPGDITEAKRHKLLLKMLIQHLQPRTEVSEEWSVYATYLFYNGHNLENDPALEEVIVK